MVQIISQNCTKVGYLTIKEVTFDAEELAGPKEWTYVRNGQFVAGLIYNKSRNTFLLVKQYRIAVAEGNRDNPLFLEIVAGIHDQTTPEDTMLKETKEELGIKDLPYPDMELIGRVYSSPGVTCEYGYLFYVEIAVENAPPLTAGAAIENEYVEPQEYSVRRTIELLKSGQIIDSKTVSALNWWLANKADWETIQWSRQL